MHATYAGASGQEVIKREINTEATPAFLILIIHYPPLLCSLPVRAVEGMKGFNWKIGRGQDKVGGSGKMRMKMNRKERKREKMKNKVVVLFCQI